MRLTDEAVDGLRDRPLRPLGAGSVDPGGPAGVLAARGGEPLEHRGERLVAHEVPGAGTAPPGSHRAAEVGQWSRKRSWTAVMVRTTAGATGWPSRA